MILAPVLLLVASLATDPLEGARQAFARGEYAAAESLALEKAPGSGAALYLAGLARFRAGRPAEALDAFDQAGRAADRPELAAWQFNRAACLYQLGRFEEAEAAYEAAAADSSLAPVALANAGFAALDAGSVERAAAFATRARANASERALELIEDLEAQLAATNQPPPPADEGSTDAYHLGLAAFDSGRFAEARTHFQRAAELDPTSGRNRLMAGAAALRLGAREQARADLEEALTLRVDARAAEVARDYLDSLMPGLRSSGRGGGIWAGAGLGYDSNVLQLGSSSREIFQAPRGESTGSMFASAALALAYRWKPDDALFAELAYAGEQRAYLAPDAQDYSIQQHVITGGLELSPGGPIRVGVSATGEVAFTGLSTFRALQAVASVGGWMALDERDETSTRLDVSFGRKTGLSSEFAYLTGHRLDATISQELRIGRVTAIGWLRYRDERIGTLVETEGIFAPPPLCPIGCSQQYVIPLGWTGDAAGASARFSLTSSLELGLDAGTEWRTYRGESYLELTYADGAVVELDRRLRQDQRIFGSVVATAQLGRGFALTARYDLVVNTSNVDTRLPSPEHRLDYANESFEKHLLTLELSLEW
jgi:tetratricopeptide (TPR) repeat protein